MDAIVNAPSPRNVHELQSFIGLLKYYSKFICNLALVHYPLNQSLCSNVKWKWSYDCQKAFEKVKSLLVDSDVLVHYNPDLQIILAVDTSNCDVSAVISHIMPNGLGKPVAFASRTLLSSEHNYSQLDKEALSLILAIGIKKFHKFLYGQHFTIITDHKLLTFIFSPKKGIPTLAAARLQRCSILLSACHYNIQYCFTSQHSNADMFSHLPLATPLT